MTPELALFDVIAALLLADPAVSAIAGGKIFDEVPTAADGSNGRPEPPWVYLGPIGARRLETGCGDTWTTTARLYAASTGFGRREAWELGSAVRDALEGQEPTLAAPYRLVEILRCIQGGDVIEDGRPKAVFVDVTTIITRTS